MSFFSFTSLYSRFKRRGNQVSAMFRANGRNEMSKKKKTGFKSSWLTGKSPTKSNQSRRPSVPLKSVGDLGQGRKWLPGTVSRRQSPKITGGFKLWVFIFFQSAVVQTMLCLRKGQRFDTEAKNMVPYNYVGNHVVSCVTSCLCTANEMRNVNSSRFSLDVHLKSAGD